MKKTIMSLVLVAGLAATISLYGAECPTECATTGGTPTGYCEPGDGSEGDAECKSTGTGEKSCTGTYTPLQCNPSLQ